MNNYEKEKEQFEQFINHHPVWIIATGSQNDISASSISILYHEAKIYFQTDINFEKIKHILANPHVALCCANYQLKGTAKILGSTIDEKNGLLMKYYQKAHPDSFRRYSKREKSCLVEVTLESIKIWDYLDGEPYITNINCVQHTESTTKYI
jgi:general stress protein 26